ncbi:MAG: hypothetical protein ACD_22C00089G0008 [uncultured bacterium]|nr:MAG: hypothetical protein ACD_22C00089G0008 [uncultured bacterium]
MRKLLLLIIVLVVVGVMVSIFSKNNSKDQPQDQGPTQSLFKAVLNDATNIKDTVIPTPTASTAPVQKDSGIQTSVFI